MRFWITKNSEFPIREQLVRQVPLGILSEDSPADMALSKTLDREWPLDDRPWLPLARGRKDYSRVRAGRNLPAHASTVARSMCISDAGSPSYRAI
jgi:hypothetical protein